MISNESQAVKEKFISLLGKVGHGSEIKNVELDSRKENQLFLFFVGLMTLLLVVTGVYIVLSDPYYSRISGKLPEFLFSFGYHSIILAGILKAVRQDEPVLKHIFASCSVVLVFGVINLLFRFPFIGSKPFVWVILPLVAKFSATDLMDPWYIAASIIVPVIAQFGLLALLYRKEWQSMIFPYVSYAITANTITLFLLMSPFVSGL